MQQHQSLSNVEPPSSLGDQFFDAAAYVQALRAAGADPQPVRGEPGHGELGSITIAHPDDADARCRLAAVEGAFADRRAADPFALGRVAELLFHEAATARFLAVAGDDLSAAFVELGRLAEESKQACRREARILDRFGPHLPVSRAASAAADVAGEAYEVAFAHVAAMPIRSQADLAAKASFARQLCRSRDEEAGVLDQIAAFRAAGRPGRNPVSGPIAA